jgi:uncharacterized membrane protein YbaN (DUF454 family)
MQEIGVTKSKKFQRFAVVALGWVLILLGIVGLVLPVVPGAVLMVVGFLMVNPQCLWLRRLLEKCQVWFPVLAPAIRHFSTSGESRQRLFKVESRRFWSAQFEV